MNCDLRRGNRKTLVVFVHGFMGGPKQFDDMADAVFGLGCSCASILLPGHGTSWREFVTAGLDDWEGHLSSEIARISKGDESIYLVGHSMGGLLALNQSLCCDRPIAGVFLIAPPMKLYSVQPRPLLSRIKLIFYPKKHPVKAAYLRANSVKSPDFFSLFLFFRPMRQLFRLIKKARKNLGKVNAPVVVICSKGDETVSHKSAIILEKELKKTKVKRIELQESLHAYYPEQELRIILSELLMFIR